MGKGVGGTHSKPTNRTASTTGSGAQSVYVAGLDAGPGEGGVGETAAQVQSHRIDDGASA